MPDSNSEGRNRIQAEQRAVSDELRAVFPGPKQFFDSDAIRNELANARNWFDMVLDLWSQGKRVARKYPDDWNGFMQEAMLLEIAYRQLWQDQPRFMMEFAMCRYLRVSCRGCQRQIGKAVRERARIPRAVMSETSAKRGLSAATRLSQRQQKAVREGFVPVMEKIFQAVLAGDLNPLDSANVISPEQRKKFSMVFPSLAALPPGPTADSETQRIRRLDAELKAQGKRYSDADVARRAYPDYVQSDSATKREYREIVRSATRHLRGTSPQK